MEQLQLLDALRLQHRQLFGIVDGEAVVGLEAFVEGEPEVAAEDFAGDEDGGDAAARRFGQFVFQLGGEARLFAIVVAERRAVFAAGEDVEVEWGQILNLDIYRAQQGQAWISKQSLSIYPCLTSCRTSDNDRLKSHC
jgi:hypothetical protein